MPPSRYSEQRAYLPESLYGICPDRLPASPHRTGHSSGLHPEDSPYMTVESMPHSPAIPTGTMPIQQQQTPHRALRLPAPMDMPTPGDDTPTEVGMTRSNRNVRPTTVTRIVAPLQAVPTASPKVYTIGYSQPGARLVIDTLVWHEGWSLIDIRRAPLSTWTDWTERSLVQRYGPAYVHVPELGNLNYRNHHLPIVLADAPTGIRQVMQALEEGQRCLLLCGCKDYRTCHRHVIAGRLQQEGVTVTHLVTQSLPPEQVRIGHADSGVALSLLLTGQQLQTAATCGLLTLSRTHSITVPVAGRRQSLTVQVSLTAWPSTVSRRLPVPQQGGSR
jgi:Active DUF488-N3 subclade